MNERVLNFRNVWENNWLGGFMTVEMNQQFTGWVSELMIQWLSKSMLELINMLINEGASKWVSM